jgi:glucose-6-phosphate dehydrogenase assembly protein OpcA
LLAAWLSLRLDLKVTLTLKHDESSDDSIHSVTFSRSSGDVALKRVNDHVVRLTQPGQPTHDVTLPNRSLRDCLSEELRRLDPDVVYGEVITQGLMLVRETSA